MEPRLSCAVMTHPRRHAAAEALRRAHPELELRIVTDPAPGEPAGALRAARQAWGAVADGATHHLVVQDDMILAERFSSYAEQAAAARPGDILCFFTEWGSRTSHAVRLATADGASWVPVLDPYIPTAATLYPADVARKLAAYEGSGVPDDVLLLDFVRDNGITALVSVPNLAEHTRSPSLIGNDLLMGPRRSAYFGASPPSGGVWRGTISPHLSIFEGLSVCHVRQPDGAWQPVKTHDHLGLSVGEALDLFARALHGHEHIASVVAEPILFQLWLTALAYPARPAAPALHTFAPGALRRFLPLSHLDSLADLVAPLIEPAMGDGVGVTSR